MTKRTRLIRVYKRCLGICQKCRRATTLACDYMGKGWRYGRHGYLVKLGHEVPIASIDHIVPKSKGGTNNLENLQLLCVECNAGKGCRLD